MLRVGLTGGLASGKSFVGECLRDLGCFIVKADELGHSVLLTGGEAYAATVREFGSGILNTDGSIDRRKLAAEVFNKPERLAVLSGLVHPPVRARTQALLAKFAQREPHGIAVVEAAILVETGSYREYDRLIVAACTREQQLERAMRRDGISRSEAEDRLARQLPLAEKTKVADFVIDTSGAMEETAERTRVVYQALREAALSEEA